MNKGKWILLGSLFTLAILLNYLLDKIGIKLVGEAAFWFGLFIVALSINAIAVPEEYRKYTKWFCYLFLALALASCSQQKTKQSNDSNLIVRKEKTVEKETALEKIVKVSGRKINGTLIYVDEAGYYQVSYLGGKIYDTPEDKVRNAAYDVLGTSYDPEWKDSFIYSNIPEVKAVEALIIVDGEIGSGNEKVYQLSERSKEVKVWVNEYLRIFRHEPDVVDQAGDHYCFSNNYGNWKFKIKRLE